jgi:hypothetical protein
VSDIAFARLEQFQSAQGVIQRDTTAAVREHHVIASRLHYSTADGVSLAPVLLISNYLYIDSIAIFFADFFGLISRRVPAAVVGDYNLTLETISLQEFTGGFDIVSNFAEFVKRWYDDG